MIGAPHVDQVAEAAAELVVVIGDVGGEIGPRPIRLLERPIDLVAELGGAEQGLRARLPIVGQFALGRLEHAFIDQPAVGKRGQRGIDRAARDEVALGDEGVKGDAERRQIGADQRQHLGDGELAHRREPNRRRLIEPAVAVALEQLAAGLFQVFAGIEALGFAARRLMNHRAVQQTAVGLRLDHLLVAK